MTILFRKKGNANDAFVHQSTSSSSIHIVTDSHVPTTNKGIRLPFRTICFYGLILTLVSDKIILLMITLYATVATKIDTTSVFVSIRNPFETRNLQSFLYNAEHENATSTNMLTTRLQRIFSLYNVHHAVPAQTLRKEQEVLESSLMGTINTKHPTSDTKYNTTIVMISPQNNKPSLHYMIQTNPKNKRNNNSVFYSFCRQDRSGSVITDMLYAHSYAYIHNLTYGGACCLNKAYPRIETIDLIQRLSLTTILPFQCPSNKNIGSHLQIPIQQVEFHNITITTYDESRNKTKHITLQTISKLSSQIYHRDIYSNDEIVTNHFSISYRMYLQQLIQSEKKMSAILHESSQNSNIIEQNSNKKKRDHDNSNNTTILHQNLSNTNSKLNYEIVVHIRRGDIKPCFLKQRYLPNIHYLMLIKEAKQMIYDQRKKYIGNDQGNNEPVLEPNIHVTIYSERDSYESFDIFYQHNYTVELDTDDLMTIWDDISNADVAILSRSFFSFVPALLQQNPKQQIVVTPPFFGFRAVEGWYSVNTDFMEYSDSVTRIMATDKNCHQNMKYNNGEMVALDPNNINGTHVHHLRHSRS
jgi:hypothetical protein